MTSSRSARFMLWTVALALLTMLGACATSEPGQPDELDSAATGAEEEPRDAAAEPAPEPADLPVYDPHEVVIPSIDVRASLVEVGLNADGSMEVPDFGLAAWYTEGPPPGARGSSVIVAHVDSREGPDVFYRLGELEEGDEVQVVDEEGREMTFEVTGREQADKDEIAHNDRIWRATSEHALTLITCDGDFDASIGHYEDNLIVYTQRVD